MAEVVLKAHHASKINLVGTLTGHDSIHSQTIAQFLEWMQTLPPKTEVLLTLGPDEICEVCPLNKGGDRYNPSLIENRDIIDPLDPCDPRSSSEADDERISLYNIIQGILQRKGQTWGSPLTLTVRDIFGEKFIPFP